MSIRLMLSARISPKRVSNRTVTRFLERKGYHFLQARKKRLSLGKGYFKFAKDTRQDFSKVLKKDNEAFYLDYVSVWYSRFSLT